MIDENFLSCKIPGIIELLMGKAKGKMNFTKYTFQADGHAWIFRWWVGEGIVAVSFVNANIQVIEMSRKFFTIECVIIKTQDGHLQC